MRSCGSWSPVVSDCRPRHFCRTTHPSPFEQLGRGLSCVTVTSTTCPALCVRNVVIFEVPMRKLWVLSFLRLRPLQEPIKTSPRVVDRDTAAELHGPSVRCRGLLGASLSLEDRSWCRSSSMRAAPSTRHRRYRRPRKGPSQGRRSKTASFS